MIFKKLKLSISHKKSMDEKYVIFLRGGILLAWFNRNTEEATSSHTQSSRSVDRPMMRALSVGDGVGPLCSVDKLHTVSIARPNG